MGLLDFLKLKLPADASDPGAPPRTAPAAGAGAPRDLPVHDQVISYESAVGNLAERRGKLKEGIEALRSKKLSLDLDYSNGRIGSAVYMQRDAELDGKRASLSADEAALAKEAKTLAAHGESLAADLAKEQAAGMGSLTEAERKAIAGMETELRGMNRGNAGEILARARGRVSQKGAASLGMMAGIAVTLITAYLIVQDIRYILESDNALEALSRTAKVGAGYAVGAAEMALVKYVADSTVIGAVVTMVLTMPSDQGGASDAEEARARTEAERKQEKEMAHKEHMAIGAFLAEHAPGSVMFVEDTYQILDRKLWDETVKRVRQLRIENMAKTKLGLSKKARELGAQDGRMSEEFTHVDDIKKWPEVKDLPGADTRFLELFDDYKAGFAEANAKRAAVIALVRKAGYKDGKAGSKAQREGIPKWPQVVALVTEGRAVLPWFYAQLWSEYDEAYDAAQGKPPEL